MYRIGVDVGGTNTDSAILDTRLLTDKSRGVLATCKTPTTTNVTEGIQTAIENVLQQSNVDRNQILSVAVGTTHFVNAVVEIDSRRLSRVAVVRLCGPYTKKIPPFSDFPYALRDVVEGPHYYLDGGLEIDGREIRPLNPDQIKETTIAIHEAGIRTVALVGVFSALDHDDKHEERCKSMMLEACPDLSIVCSHAIGGPGLLPRENATILNAAILSFARATISGFRRAIHQLKLDCALYVTQNDGTLADADSAAELPIKTFASGPTNSLTGAAFLQGLDLSSSNKNESQIIVVDIGGTTTDICALLPSGFPRQASNFVEVGGVRTAFSMPEVLSIGLGGGSQVRTSSANSRVTVGPDSVAHRLTQDALVFGGSVATATDVVVAAGHVRVGDASKVASFPQNTADAARREIKRILEKAIDRMKVSSAPVTVLLVGGGSIILMDQLDGVAECLCPPHHDSANAVGAAIAKVAGEVDVIEILANKDAEEALKTTKEAAIANAVTRGADPTDVKIVEVNKFPLQYVTNNATRFVVKAVGNLKVDDKIVGSTKDRKDTAKSTDDIDTAGEHRKREVLEQKLGSMARPTEGIDLTRYRPDVRDEVWYVSPIDVELIASGTGVLGTGGGGSSYNMALYVLDLLRNGSDGKIRVIPPKSLKDTDVCVFGSGYGAPSVSDERLQSRTEVFDSINGANRVLGYDDFHAVVADEIGGGNGLVTFPTSAQFNRPVIDCDLMGRAYPTIEHCTPYLYGHPILPISSADGKGNTIVLMSAESGRKAESMLRAACIELGNSMAVAPRPLNGDVIKKYAVPNTVSQAWYLGRAVHLARQNKIDFVDALADITPVKLLYTGKIVDVSRDVSRGYTMGRCLIAPLSVDEYEDIDDRVAESRSLVVPFQNEYLAASLVDPSEKPGKEEVLCVVPDLISILGQDGEALGSPDLRYGLKVQVIAMPAHPLWTTPEGLKVGGPEYFGLDMKWKSVGEYKVPKSVIEEFG